jgi:hypothetical protein
MAGYFGDGEAVQPDVNITTVRDVYRGADGGTTATMGAASSPDMYMATSQRRGSVAVTAPRVGGGGIMWWVGLAIIVALMLVAARKTGQADEFKNLRASTYNILFITLTAILGITATKIIAVKVQKWPGLSGFSDVVLAV